MSDPFKVNPIEATLEMALLFARLAIRREADPQRKSALAALSLDISKLSRLAEKLTAEPGQAVAPYIAAAMIDEAAAADRPPDLGDVVRDVHAANAAAREAAAKHPNPPAALFTGDPAAVEAALKAAGGKFEVRPDRFDTLGMASSSYAAKIESIIVGAIDKQIEKIKADARAAAGFEPFGPDSPNPGTPPDLGPVESVEVPTYLVPPGKLAELVSGGFADVPGAGRVIGKAPPVPAADAKPGEPSPDAALTTPAAGPGELRGDAMGPRSGQYADEVQTVRVNSDMTHGRYENLFAGMICPKCQRRLAQADKILFPANTVSPRIYRCTCGMYTRLLEGNRFECSMSLEQLTKGKR